MSCINILRYFTQHLSKIPLSIIKRFMDQYEILSLVTQLLHQKPWQITNVSNENFQNNLHDSTSISSNTANKPLQIYQYIDKKFQLYNDRYKVIAIEGQIWLIIYHLLCDPKCKNLYQMTTIRKTCILSLKKYLNQILLNQLPFLSLLQRYIEELRIIEYPATNPSYSHPASKVTIPSNITIIEQIPLIRQNLIKKMKKMNEKEYVKLFIKNFKIENFQNYFDNYFENNFKFQKKKKKKHQDDLFYGEIPKCKTCGINATKRCKNCQIVWYCSRTCQLNDWKNHQKNCKKKKKQNIDLSTSTPRIEKEKKKRKSTTYHHY